MIQYNQLTNIHICLGNWVHIKFGQPNKGRFTFYIEKLTREQKLDIYQKRKLGYFYSLLSKEYGIKDCNIKYLISLIHYHDKGILRENNNRKYSYKLKLEIINKVLLKNHSMYYIVIEYGLPSPGMLVNWIKSYKKMVII